MGYAVSPAAAKEILRVDQTCVRCGFEWEQKQRKRSGGQYMRKYCDDCFEIARREAGRTPITPENWEKILHHAELRLAVVQAVSLLRTGRVALALAVLESVPGRAQ